LKAVSARVGSYLPFIGEQFRPLPVLTNWKALVVNNLAPADLHSLRAGPFPGQSIHRPEKKHWYYELMYGAFYPIGYQQRYTCALMNSPSQFSFVKTRVLNTRLTRSTASKAAYELILASNSQDVYCPETFPLRLVKFHLAMSLRPPNIASPHDTFL
ncbi:hypothetical protein AB8G89_20720, partial [Salmonella enterica]